MGYLASVLDSLPPVVINRYAGMYGCRYVLSRYCGLRNIPWQGYLDIAGGNWQHGWHPPEHNIHPEIVVGWDGRSSDFKNRKHLRLNDYRWVKAIGMPILYASSTVSNRIPRSLLVMPSHSLDETQHSWDFSCFAQNLRAITPNYDFVAACIHPACIRKGYWLRELESLGIPVIEGATSTDQNALYRMSNLLSSFTDVVGNGFGSHLVYANYFGARVSLLPPWPLVREADYMNDNFYRNNSDAVRKLLEVDTEESVRRRYPFLFSSEYTFDNSWGKYQLGTSCVLGPSQIKRAVGWDLITMIRFSLLQRLKSVARPRGIQ
jgi:hypothetical protein